MDKESQKVGRNAIRDGKGSIMRLETTMFTTAVSVRVPLDVAKHLKDNALDITNVLVDAIGDYSRHGEYEDIRRIEYQWRYELVSIECTQQVMTLLRAWMGRQSFGGRDPQLDDIGKWVGIFLANYFNIPIPSLSGKLASKALHAVAVTMRVEEGHMLARDRARGAKNLLKQAVGVDDV